MFAKVVVDVKASNIDTMYTYRIPEELEDFVFVGSRVYVGFGTRTIMGYVIETIDEKDYNGIVKDIIDVLDYSKELTTEQVELAKFIAETNRCSLIKALELMYPSFLKTKYRKFITIKNFDKLDANIAFLFAGKNKILLTKEMLQEYPKIKTEIKNGNLGLEHDIFYYGKRKYVKYYSLNELHVSTVENLSELRQKVIKYLNQAKEAVIEDIRNDVGCSPYLVKKLVEEGLIRVTEKPFNKEQAQSERKLIKNINFNLAQKEIKEKYDSLNSKPFLLYSNDELFKYDLYLEIVKDNILDNKKVLIVTPSLVYNYSVYNFLRHNLEGYNIVNFSSDLPNSEYYNNYMTVKMNLADVVVTTKVGAFSPMDNLGAIIVIDEDNLNYLGEYHPKYSLLEAMKFRSKFQGAKLLLSSSTPSIESFYQYHQAKYYLLKYKISFNNEVSLVNMKDELIENNNSIISKELQNSLQDTLSNKKQAMLILNAKGYSPSMQCKKCGKVVKCPKCNISLMYSKENNEYKCRYCGQKIEQIECECGSHNFTTFGIGLEMVREKLYELFPNARVLLLDSDSLKDSEDYKNAVLLIESGDVDIIIGTNNIVSLINYSNIELVSLLAVDNLLNVSDYRASYNTFSLISKLLNNKKVIIQGYDLEHYSIINGIKDDYNSYYKEEINIRSTLNYPPFVEVNKLIISGDFKQMYHVANYFRKVVQNVLDATCLGPTYDKVKRGVQLIIKHNDFEKLMKVINEVEKKFSDYKVEYSYERFPRFL